MAERVAVIILLVEDQNQENLIRRYLQCIGHDNRCMRIQKLPKGQGSGEQFVRERYASEVRAVRSQLTKTKACLIAMIDADTGSVDDRRQQLGRALKDADEPPRGPDEPILNLIPRRNVETWVLCLNSHAVDEITNYRGDQRVDAQSIKQAAGNLFSGTRPNQTLSKTCVPSLQDCVPEFARMPGNA